MTAILPGSIIGLLGGGQLGRMTAMAARTMGYDVHVLDPAARCPAQPFASRVITASWDDTDAAARLAEGADVVALEIDGIPLATLEAAERQAPLRPSSAVHAIVRDVARQQEWLRLHGFPVRPSATAISAELSVMVARSPSGEMRAFPPSRDNHLQGVLTWSVIPGGFDETAEQRATDIACGIAEQLQVVGLIAVELLLLEDGSLCVDALSARPHTAYHHSERACITSQYEQFVRAICGLPLGDTEVVRPAAVYILPGELWTGAQPPDIAGVLALPGVRVHLYGKHDVRPGRAMGHLSACDDSSDVALDRVVDAYRRLTISIDAP